MTDHAELIERLRGVSSAMLDWAEDFRRVGSIDGEKSEKSRAELLKSAATALDALVAENARLRELRRVSFIQMLCILRQNGNKLEIYNSNATQIDPYSDEIIQTASDVHDSVFLERRPAKARAALAQGGET